MNCFCRIVISFSICCSCERDCNYNIPNLSTVGSPPKFHIQDWWSHPPIISFLNNIIFWGGSYSLGTRWIPLEAALCYIYAPRIQFSVIQCDLKKFKVVSKRALMCSQEAAPVLKRPSSIFFFPWQSEKLLNILKSGLIDFWTLCCRLSSVSVMEDWEKIFENKWELWHERNGRHFIEWDRKKSLDGKVGEFSRAKSGEETEKLMKG